MSLARLRSLWRNLTHRERMEQDLDAEMRSYLEMVEGEKAEGGLPAGAARREALLQLGGMEQVKEEVREIRTGRMFEEFLQDLRYGARSLRKNAVFASVAIVALALGIGVNTAIFSVAYGILLRPLPFPEANRVALVFMRFYPQNFDFGTMCIADYLDWKAGNHVFQEPSIYSARRMDIGGSGEPEQLRGAQVSAGFFSTLMLRPVLGRAFETGEDSPGAELRAVISETLWRRRFGGSRAALGQTLLINGAPATIIGVMPAGVQFPQTDTEVWTNLRIAPPTRRGPFFYHGIARLKPGVTLEQAQAETNAIGRRIMQENPYYKRLTMPVISLREGLVGRVKPALLVMMAAVGLVLLIAVVNVANLMLARATVREREMALRLSLGAGRGRLIRQLLTESMLLAVTGGVAGLALAYGAIQMIQAWNPGNLPLIEYIRLDAGALGFMAVVAVMTGVLFGLAPALQASRADLNSTLKEGARGAAGGRARRGTRSTLVIAEIALSMVLLVGAGLMLRSLARLQDVSGGFQAPPRQIFTIAISTTGPNYKDAAPVIAYYDRVLEAARQTPGVESAALSDTLPPNRQADADTFMIQGQSLAPGQSNPAVSDAAISADYFRTMRIPLLRGRYFTEHDREDAARVMIISESMAHHFFPDRDPIGQHIKESGPDYKVPYREVVGVVGDVKYMGLQNNSDNAYYMPFHQDYSQQMFLAVRSSSGVSLASTLRRAIQALDPGVTVSQVSTMKAALEESYAQPRFNTTVLAFFAGIALLLAAVGIYGLIAYSVAQRTHEIGVRMALGAGRAGVVRMVVRQGALLACAGIGLGLAGALALTRLLSGLLFGTSTTDPLTFGLVAAGLLGLTLVASFVPAARAARIDPTVALRYE